MLRTITDLNKLAEEIVKQNQYLTLATINDDGTAWVSPVVYTYDKEYNFYFISRPIAKHSKNISKREKLSFAIFDSSQKFGEGVGLQIEADAKKLSLKDSLSAAKLYFERPWPYGKPSSIESFKRLFKGKIYYFYKLKPTKVWMNDPREQLDVRVEVKL